jgi:hypothetical protein
MTMKNLLKKKSDSSTLQAELGRLEARKADAERHRSETLQSLEEARQARRDGLSAEDFDLATSAKRIKDLENTAADLAALIADFEQASEATAERFRNATDTENREAAAARLEQIAKAAEGEAGEFVKAIAALGKATRALLQTIPTEVGIFAAHHMNRPGGRPEGSSLMASGREAVAAALADGLASEIPELFDNFYASGYHRQLNCVMDASEIQPSFRSPAATKPIPAQDAVRALITSRLRTRAAAIRSGEAEPLINDIRSAPMPQRSPETLDLIAIDDFSLFARHGLLQPRRIIVTKGRRESFLEKDCATLVATGAFVKADSAEGRALLAKIEHEATQRKSRVSSAKTFDDVRDLGDPLGLVTEFEALTNTVEATEAIRAVG